MLLKFGLVAVDPRHRARPALLGAAALFSALVALYACGTSPESGATTLAGAAVVSSPAPAATTTTSTVTTSKMFGADARPLPRVPTDNPGKGLVYRGLTAPRTGPCVGGYQLAGK